MRTRKKVKHSFHHRLPASRGGTDHPDNMVKTTQTKHRAWHTLFSNLMPHDIADEINRNWIPPDYELIVVKRR